MNIGIVCWWFNRGQATVGRQLRDLLDELGHRTYVLARPSSPGEYHPGFISESDVWQQPDVTFASEFMVPINEYLQWVESNELSTVFFDENFQFETITHLRRGGIRTIGRFVWEHFSPFYVPEALEAYDVIYSLTSAEQRRYHSLGIDSPRIQWGCHPELLEAATSREYSEGSFFYPGGYLSRRKSTGAVVRAFSKAKGKQLRLIIKSQRPMVRSDLLPWGPRRRELMQTLERTRLIPSKRYDPRIQCIHDDLSQLDYYALLSSNAVCLAPSRWEGLGLHFYEAAAFGMPIITNDGPPMNEWIRSEENGLLVRSYRVGFTESGIPVIEPDIDDLRTAIERLADPEFRASLSEGMRRTRKALDWNDTLSGFKRLLEQ